MSLLLSHYCLRQIKFVGPDKTFVIRLCADPNLFVAGFEFKPQGDGGTLRSCFSVRIWPLLLTFMFHDSDIDREKILPRQ